jgi:hypothetical protein
MHGQCLETGNWPRLKEPNMSRMLGLAVAAGLGISGLAVPAQAIPLGQSGTVETDSSVLLVRQGCGIGWHRDFYGVCVPNRSYYFDRPVYRPVYPTVYPQPYPLPRVYNPYPPRYIAPPPVIFYP